MGVKGAEDSDGELGMAAWVGGRGRRQGRRCGGCDEAS